MINPSTTLNKQRRVSGFTIIELLIVIVVIAILATVSIISYNGIQNKAEQTRLKSDLKTVANMAEMACATIGCVDNVSKLNDGKGIKLNSGTKLQYSGGNRDFCITVSSTKRKVPAFYFKRGGEMKEGVCDGHEAPDLDGGIGGSTIDSGWLAITAGSYHTCAIASDNQAYCWGFNGTGQLGNNSTSISLLPVAVDTSSVLKNKTIKSITAGNSHTCAIASDDQAYCWGNGDHGQLGNNYSGQNFKAPVAVSTSGLLKNKTIKSISVGGHHTCAIASDNQAYCWGYNYYGQLGNNSTENSSIPVAVNTLGALKNKTIKSITAGSAHTCAIASDDQAYCWGYNASHGRLGNNSTENSSVPVVVDTSIALKNKTVKSIVAGVSHTCAIASDNQAYCWGYNAFRQLGNNSNQNSKIPVAVSTSGLLKNKTITSIVTGNNHTCAIASDNQAYCWGLGNSGQLGNNSNPVSSAPVAVDTSGLLKDKTVKYITAGNSHTCAIASDDQAYCWGANTHGQFGNNSKESSLAPVKTTEP